MDGNPDWTLVRQFSPNYQPSERAYEELRETIDGDFE
jgi:hypothetical protein